MKKTIALVSVLLLSSAAQAAGNVGQCVFPKTKVGKNGYLELAQPVSILRSPDDKEGQPLKLMTAFKVQAERGQYVQLVEAESGKVIGWSKLSHFQRQDLRNCNL